MGYMKRFNVDTRKDLEKVLADYICTHNDMDNEKITIKFSNFKSLFHVQYVENVDKGWIYGTYHVKYGKTTKVFNGSWDMVDYIVEECGF
jgi:hypothetical protein